MIQFPHRRHSHSLVIVLLCSLKLKGHYLTKNILSEKKPISVIVHWLPFITTISSKIRSAGRPPALKRTWSALNFHPGTLETYLCTFQTPLFLESNMHVEPTSTPAWDLLDFQIPGPATVKVQNVELFLAGGTRHLQVAVLCNQNEENRPLLRKIIFLIVLFIKCNVHGFKPISQCFFPFLFHEARYKYNQESRISCNCWH